MSKLVRNVHFLIIIYALWCSFEVFNEKNEELSLKKDTFEASVSQIRSMRRKLLKIKKIKSELRKSEEEFKNIESSLLLVREKLPSQFDDKRDYDYFKEVGKKIKIKHIFLSSGQSENKGYFKVKDLNLELKDITFLQFIIFLEHLSKSKKIFNMNSLQIENRSKNSRGRYQLISARIKIQTYRSNLLNN